MLAVWSAQGRLHSHSIVNCQSKILIHGNFSHQET